MHRFPLLLCQTFLSKQGTQAAYSGRFITQSSELISSFLFVFFLLFFTLLQILLVVSKAKLLALRGEPHKGLRFLMGSVMLRQNLHGPGKNSASQPVDESCSCFAAWNQNKNQILTSSKSFTQGEGP